MSEQVDYWDSVAEAKEFSHGIDVDRFARLVRRTGVIIDVGCGYGRMTEALHAVGFERVIGVDASPGMLARARLDGAGAQYLRGAGDRLPIASGSAHAVLLQAVLTCIVDDDDQRALVREVKRMLRPCGYVVVTDLWIQSDDRSRERYENARPEGAPRGVFEHAEGATFRHHERAWIDELFEDFSVISDEDVVFASMNGNPTSGFRRVLSFG